MKWLNRVQMHFYGPINELGLLGMYLVGDELPYIYIC